MYRLSLSKSGQLHLGVPYVKKTHLQQHVQFLWNFDVPLTKGIDYIKTLKWISIDSEIERHRN